MTENKAVHFDAEMFYTSTYFLAVKGFQDCRCLDKKYPQRVARAQTLFQLINVVTNRLVSKFNCKMDQFHEEKLVSKDVKGKFSF